MSHLRRYPMCRFSPISAGRTPLFILPFILMFISCQHADIKTYNESETLVALVPDYAGIKIPPNIAPMNFSIINPGRRFIVKFSGRQGGFEIRSRHGKIIIPGRKWRKLLSENRGYGFTIEIAVLAESGWVKYPKISNQIAEDAIDPYLVYRLIAPGYELWGEMGIYQRCLENFDESAIMLNSLSDQNCMNCHSFRKNDPQSMLFHMRGTNAGTYFLNEQTIERVSLKTDSTISAGVYPSWHPGGTKIAFSTNKTMQFFHALPGKRLEVFDMESDIAIYDHARNILSTPPQLNNKDWFETFPAWSPDGRYLYFCSAKSKPLNEYNQVRYNLLRIGYNQENNAFGTVDTLYSAFAQGKSVSFPRISPDGKWLIFTLSDYGNFSIWHKEADLYAMDLSDGSFHRLDISGNEAESYHGWSAEGNWLVFSSRSDDGLYTRPYFCWINKETGINTKPFVLPQKDPDFYNIFLKAFNVPELVSGKVQVTPDKYVMATRKVAKEAKTE